MSNRLTKHPFAALLAAGVAASCGSSGSATTSGDGGVPDATTSCGAAGQPCCYGTACNNGLMCGAGTCVSQEAQHEGGLEASTDAASEAAPDASDASLAPDVTCGDTTSDPLNCGRCGHDCCGGLCQASICHPLTLVSGQTGEPQGLAIDSVNVYFTQVVGGTVMKCAIGGCNNTPTQLASGQSAPAAITVDTTSVYWVNDSSAGGVLQCATTGCADTPEQYASTAFPAGIAVDAKNVYFPSAGDVVACAVGGCSGTPTPIATGQLASGVAADGTNVYWTNDTGTGTIMKCAAGGCGGTPTQLASGQNYPGAIAFDSTSVYWANAGIPGGIMKCAVAGCNGTPTQLASGEPSGVAADGKYVYWTNQSGGVMATAVDGSGTAITLATGGGGSRGIALDAACVYWADTSGTVTRVAKP